MLKRVLTCAAAALAMSLGASAVARAAVVDFEDIVVAPNSYLYNADSFTYGGLFFQDQSITIIPDGLLSLPFNNHSQFMEVGAQSDVMDRNLVISLDGGGAFDLTQLQMGLGDLNNQDLDKSDFVTIQGHKANCASNCDTDPLTVSVSYDWTTYNFSTFTGLDSITFFQQVMMVGDVPTTDAGWLAFDNIHYAVDTGGPIPEPAQWALMIAGFGAVGGMLRRRRGLAHAA